MDEMQWMTAELTLHEELVMEQSIRSIDSTEDVDQVKALCAALIRQGFHQRKLLSQAVGRIAEMDAQLACSD